jgi:hypothetical protein
MDWSTYVDQTSIALSLPIAPEYKPGVVANLERTETIAQLFLEFPLPSEIEIAPTFEP